MSCFRVVRGGSGCCTRLYAMLYGGCSAGAAIVQRNYFVVAAEAAAVASPKRKKENSEMRTRARAYILTRIFTPKMFARITNATIETSTIWMWVLVLVLLFSSLQWRRMKQFYVKHCAKARCKMHHSITARVLRIAYAALMQSNTRCRLFCICVEKLVFVFHLSKFKLNESNRINGLRQRCVENKLCLFAYFLFATTYVVHGLCHRQLMFNNNK